MAAQTHIDFGGIYRPQGQLASNPLAPSSGPLSERAAAHLLRRAGFGGTPDEVRRYTGTSVDAAVESLVRFPNTDGLPGPGNLYDPMPDLFEAYKIPKGTEERKEAIKAVDKEKQASVHQLQVWWLNRMLATPAPLQEKMALYYHGHFTTFALRKAIHAVPLYDQNQLFREYALGNFRELTRKVSKGAAMLQYLDNALNVKSHPNENFARELMELFTLGVNQYTEQDIRESARAWTGWTYNKRREVAYFAPQLHDDGTKTFFGRTGNFNGDDIIDIIFAQPQAARFLAANLLSFYVYNDPEPELIDAVAAIVRKHDYELAPVMSAILRSNVFYSERAYRSLVKSPAEYVVGTYKALGLSKIEPNTPAAMNRMGQSLFRAPTVAGWPGGQTWLTSATMIARQNFLVAMLNSETLSQSSWLPSLPMKANAAASTIAQQLLQNDLSPSSTFALQSYLGGAQSSALAALSMENFGQRVSGAVSIALATPAYQLN